MLPHPDAVRLVVEFLTQHRIPYMVIGGLANSIWGEARVTHDADFKVSIGDRALAEFRELVARRFAAREVTVPPRMHSPHVIHIWAMPGVAVDLLVAVLDYERQAIERAFDMTIGGVRARVCTAEDLIVHKAVANREQDWIDIERVLIRQKPELDQTYIWRWVREFAEALDAPDIIRRYERLQTQYDRQ